MRILLLTLFTLFLINTSNAQTGQWSVYELDSRVSIELPGEVYEMDTVIKGESLYQLYSEAQGALFIAQIISYEKDGEGRYPGLPADTDGLEVFYQNVTKGIMNTTQNKLEAASTIDIKGLSGYELIFSFENNPTRISRMLLVENKLISLVYNDELSFNTNVANMFFESLDIGDVESVNQYIGTSREFLLGELAGKLITYVFIIVFIIFVARSASKKRRKAQGVKEQG